MAPLESKDRGLPLQGVCGGTWAIHRALRPAAADPCAPAARTVLQMFPLFDLPEEAVELVHGSVGDLEDRRALRLVCKRSRALVDRRVVAATRRRTRAAPLDHSLLLTLTGAPWRLQKLDLAGCGIDAAGAAALAAATWPALLQLRLSDHCLGTAGVAALAAANWPALQILDLSRSDRIGPGALPDPASVTALAAWPDLRELRLRNSLIFQEEEEYFLAAALAACHWPQLRLLDVRGRGLSAPGMAALAGAGWTHLEELALSLCRGADPRPAMAALAAGSWPCLWRLCIDEGNFSGGGVAALAAGSWSLRELAITHCSVGAVDAAGLAASRWPLQTLRLEHVNLSVGGLAALASANWAALEELTLTECRWGDEGAAALAAAAWPKLVKLDLSKNERWGIGDIPLAAVLARSPRLQSLRLGRNRLSGGHVVALAAASLPELRELGLCTNRLTAEDVAALAAASWPRLESLDLSQQGYGAWEEEDDNAALFKALVAARIPELRRLDLSSNVGLGDAGAAVLALGRWPRLQELRLARCKPGIGFWGAQRLLQGPHWPDLRELDLRGTLLESDADAAVTEAAAARPGLVIQFGPSPTSEAGVYPRGSRRTGLEASPPLPGA